MHLIISIFATLTILFSLIKTNVIKTVTTVVVVGVLAFASLFIGPKMHYAYFTDNVFNAKLIRMETPNEIGSHGPTTHMLYFKEDSGKVHVIQNDDSLLRWKWDSKDFRASEPGQIYTVHTQGYRLGIFSIQPNLLDMTLVNNSND